MIAAGAVALAWVVSSLRPAGSWLGIEPIYAGLATAAAFAFAGAVWHRYCARLHP